MNRQYIRSRSELPGVEAFDEAPLEIPFVGSTKHHHAIDSALRSRSRRFSRRLQATQAYSTVGWLYPRTIARVKVDSQQRKPSYRGLSLAQEYPIGSYIWESPQHCKYLERNARSYCSWTMLNSIIPIELEAVRQRDRVTKRGQSRLTEYCKLMPL
jgi:hypothetical protein